MFSWIVLHFLFNFKVPYYIIDQNIPIPFAFSYVGLEWTSYIVSAGAIVSLATCLYASMFPMPRVVYAMSSDGLIFKFLSYILPKIKTPALAALATGLLSALLALLFDLNHLIDMMSIGTLMAYSLVSVCTLILRYRPNVIEPARRELGTQRTLLSYIVGESDEKLVSRIFKPMDKCDKASSHLVNAITAVAGNLKYFF
jgi:amino acid transporter